MFKNKKFAVLLNLLGKRRWWHTVVTYEQGTQFHPQPGLRHTFAFQRRDFLVFLILGLNRPPKI